MTIKSIKPKKCCAIQTYEHTVPMAIAGRRQDVDLCISDIVAALNAANIVTTNSCCGHGIHIATILLEDGREIFISNKKKEK
jgi:tRNA(Phe) wybutosine-synthesizing methylase Tyw3